jgi:hypothetical protein
LNLRRNGSPPANERSLAAPDYGSLTPGSF